jgi:hypothetical protein
MKWSLALLSATAVALTGCSGLLMTDQQQQGPNAFFQPVEQQADPIAPMTLRVVGYGAIEHNKKQSAVQRRLMGIRASKIDAFRTMAERVYGMQLSGSTTVRDMVVQNDRFRTYVDAYMHGARVISSDILPDGSVETVLEMTIDQGFRNCLQTTDRQRFHVDCRVPLANNNQYAGMQKRRIEQENSSPDSGFYFIE